MVDYPPIALGMSSAGVSVASLKALSRSRSYVLTGVNVNAAATDVGSFTLTLPTVYRVTRFTIFNASTALGTATIDLRDAGAGAGTALVSAQATTLLTGATKFVDATLVAALGTDYVTATSLFVRCVTAQGAPATVSVL